MGQEVDREGEPVSREAEKTSQPLGYAHLPNEFGERRMLAATVDLAGIADRSWDTIVVGAGPAGSMAAREAAKLGLQVLLIDRDSFPRSKVCGCCLNQAGQKLLGSDGLASIQAEGVPLRSYHLATGGRNVTLALSGNVAISRDQLDACLIRSAIQAGASFLDGAEANLLPGRGCVRVERGGQVLSTAGKLVIMATGLGASGVPRDAAPPIRAAATSRLGAGIVIESTHADYQLGTLYMACNAEGYVGIVRLEDGRVDLAAALDGAAVKRTGGIAPVVEGVISDARLPPLGESIASGWRGTPRLSQRPTQPYGAGFLLIGDAAGYVEPFTGEGIGWALAAGRAVAPLASRVAADPRYDAGPDWSRTFRSVVGRRMAACRALSWLLRRPRLVRTGIATLARHPRWLTPIERGLHAPFRFPQT